MYLTNITLLFCKCKNIYLRIVYTTIDTYSHNVGLDFEMGPFQSCVFLKTLLKKACLHQPLLLHSLCPLFLNIFFTQSHPTSFYYPYILGLVTYLKIYHCRLQSIVYLEKFFHLCQHKKKKKNLKSFSKSFF
jgi:hypothetical protein